MYDELDVWDVSVAKILEYCNPVETPPWGVDGPTTSLIDWCLNNDYYIDTPVEQHLTNRSTLLDSQIELIHAGRIAYLFSHDWDDPISFDVGIPGLADMPAWPVLDGNHRLYASIIRRDTTIMVEPSGCLDYAKQILL